LNRRKRRQQRLDGSGSENPQTEDAATASIEYIHLYPLRRGLCMSPVDRVWSDQKGDITDFPRSAGQYQ